MRPHPAPLALAACALLAACVATTATEIAPVTAEPAALEHPIEAETPCVLDGAGVFYVASDEPTRPRVRYADGQVGLGTHCAIRVENKLNRRIPPVYVNGRPIGFC